MSKEISRNAIKPIDMAQATENEIMRGGLPPHMQFYFSNPIWRYDCRCPPNFQSIPVEPIITEDAEVVSIETTKKDQQQIENQ